MAECECFLLAQFGPGQHFSGLLTGGGVHVEILDMGCSQQYVPKVLKGQESLSLETISKIEACLGIQILPTSEM